MLIQTPNLNKLAQSHQGTSTIVHVQIEHYLSTTPGSSLCIAKVAVGHGCPHVGYGLTEEKALHALEIAVKKGLRTVAYSSLSPREIFMNINTPNLNRVIEAWTLEDRKRLRITIELRIGFIAAYLHLAGGAWRINGIGDTEENAVLSLDKFLSNYPVDLQ